MITTFPTGIETVGIELEGFWDEDKLPSFDQDDLCEYCSDKMEFYPREEWGEHICDSCMMSLFDLKEDGSVYRPSGLYNVITGEYASPVLRSWEGVVEAVQTHYPDHVSNRTGLHVHIGCKSSILHHFSFSPKYWKILNDRLEGLVEAGTVKGKTATWLTNRIHDGRSDSGADVYCAPNNYNYGIEDGRYYHVNYGSFRRHRTIEVRVLPMADHGADEALAMIEQVLLSTSAYWTQPVYWDVASSTVEVEEDVTIEPEDTVIEEEEPVTLEVEGGTAEEPYVGSYPPEDTVRADALPWTREEEEEAHRLNWYAYDSLQNRINRIYPPNGHAWTEDEEMAAYQEEFERFIFEHTPNLRSQ
jgi:hypothetical protein